MHLIEKVQCIPSVRPNVRSSPWWAWTGRQETGESVRLAQDVFR